MTSGSRSSASSSRWPGRRSSASLLAGGDGGRVELDAGGMTLRIAPAPPESLSRNVAVRIFRDGGAAVTCADDALTATRSG